MPRTCRLIGTLAAAAVLLTLTGAPAGADAGRRANQCINPAGVDLNQVYDTNDAFVTPFCGDGHVGDWWRPLVSSVTLTLRPGTGPTGP